MHLEIRAKVRYNTALHYYEFLYFILNAKDPGKLWSFFSCQVILIQLFLKKKYFHTSLRNKTINMGRINK